MIRAIFFDIGSTLVTGPSGGPSSRIACALGLSSEQKRLLTTYIMTVPVQTPRELVNGLERVLGVALTERESAAVADIWHAQTKEPIPYDMAAETLTEWAVSGIKIGLLSNIWKPYLEGVETHFAGLFDKFVPAHMRLFSFEQGAMKPAKELFDRVIKAANVAPEEILMVGDSYVEDMLGAAEAGLKTAWVLHRPEKEMKNLRAVTRTNYYRPNLVVRDISAATPFCWVANSGRDEVATMGLLSEVCAISGEQNAGRN